MDTDAEIKKVLQAAIDVVTASNDGSLPADRLIEHLVIEIVARDRTIAEAGKVLAERIAAKLDKDRQEQRDRYRTTLQEIARQKLSFEMTEEGCFQTGYDECIRHARDAIQPR